MGVLIFIITLLLLGIAPATSMSRAPVQGLMNATTITQQSSTTRTEMSFG